MYSRVSAAVCKLNIIRKALNLGKDLNFTKNSENLNIYYPYNPFITENSTYYKSEINSGKMEVIDKIKSEGEEYNVLGNRTTMGSNSDLGCFYYGVGVGHAYADVGFLGCATKEISEYFGKYFGMLITEAKFSDLPDFKIIESKY